jgi:hypothetical protein
MFNKSEIMRAAWVQFRSVDLAKMSKRGRAIRFSNCLRTAWANAKRAIRATIIATAAQRIEAEIVVLENSDRLGFAGIARLTALHAQAAQMAA